MTPSNQVKEFLLECSRLGSRLFRSNVGLAWAGSKTKRIEKPGNYFVPAGALIILDPRPFKAGITGMSDTTGGTPRIITPEMVGQTVLVYTAIEAKLGTGRLSTEQADFITAIRSLGGIAGVARSVEDVARILAGEELLR